MAGRKGVVEEELERGGAEEVHVGMSWRAGVGRGAKGRGGGR